MEPDKNAMAELFRGPPILLFDGECVLCSGFVRFVIARERDPVFRFAARTCRGCKPCMKLQEMARQAQAVLRSPPVP